MTRVRVAVMGYGNVGKSAVAAVSRAPDMQLAALVRRVADRPRELAEEVPVVDNIAELEGINVLVLAVPTRSTEQFARACLTRGINTVDSFDLHGDEMLRYLGTLDGSARESGACAIIGAGWDPGVDSAVRAYMEVLASRGITHTNFGPGISLGHSVACRNIPGVSDAVSYTIPAGGGVHRREVYVELEKDADFERVRADILSDPYFEHDATVVREISDVAEVTDLGHGVLAERRGASAEAHNTTVQFSLRGTNPAITAEVMVNAARATLRMAPGAYTMGDIPPLHLLPGEREELIRRLI